jgi:hypothetical protein
MLVIGPSPLSQDRTCISGQTCQFESITGHYLSETDSFLVLHTCAANGLISRFPNGGLSTILSGSGSIVTWSEAVVTAAGGEYRLCWCRDLSGSSNNNSNLLETAANASRSSLRCHSEAEYRTDVGKFSLLGVSPLQQDRTCVSGQTCAFENLQGLGLSSNDSFWVLDTCADPSVIERLPEAGMVSPVNRQGGVISLASSVATAAGGQYRLCWCSGLVAANSCTSVKDFKVDLGKLTVVGAAPLTQDRTCVSGQTCVIDGVLGQDLATGDQFAAA